jgi:hypothetical protein
LIRADRRPASPADRSLRGSPGAALAVVLLTALACAGSGARRAWDAELTETERAAVAQALPAEAVAQLLPLSEIFYERITSRRFDSRATFEDPSVRQFFPSVAAYSDYYAALVDELDRAHIRYNRPTRVDLLGVRVADDGHLLLSLRFVGRNDLPLRWWSAKLERTDEWSWRDGRWYVVPGKV